MYLHANAKLGLAARFALCPVGRGWLFDPGGGGRFNVSPATAHRWWHRWLEAGEEARETLSCLFDRSSRPHRCPRQLAARFEEAICACRRQTGWGPRLVAGATGFPHSTVSKVLQAGRDLAAATTRTGAGPQVRVALPRRSAAHGHKPLCPLPAARPPRHRRPLSAATGRARTRVGYDYAHAIVDDRSRLAYVELHYDEKQ